MSSRKNPSPPNRETATRVPESAKRSVRMPIVRWRIGLVVSGCGDSGLGNFGVSAVTRTLRAPSTIVRQPEKTSRLE